jgi:hypothetical protein
MQRTSPILGMMFFSFSKRLFTYYLKWKNEVDNYGEELDSDTEYDNDSDELKRIKEVKLYYKNLLSKSITCAEESVLHLSVNYGKESVRVKKAVEFVDLLLSFQND